MYINKAAGFSGWLDDLKSLVGAVGLTPAILEAVGKAAADPTSSNIQAAVSAYTANGQVIPGQVLAWLIGKNESTYPNDLYRATWTWPIVVLGFVAVIYLLKKR